MVLIQIQLLLKLNKKESIIYNSLSPIQIQLLLKLNLVQWTVVLKNVHSNTTLVKVKLDPTSAIIKGKKIQIQLLLKLN